MDREKMRQEYAGGGAMLPVDALRELLDYDPVAGSLTWRVRSAEWCKSEAEADRWNQQHAGRPALQASLVGNGARLCGKLFNRMTMASRIAYALAHGLHPDRSDCVVMCNGNPADLRKENMALKSYRLISQESTMRRQPGSGSKTVGVSTDSRGRIRVRFAGKFLGYYPTPEAAEAALLGAKMARGMA